MATRVPTYKGTVGTFVTGNTGSAGIPFLTIWNPVGSGTLVAIREIQFLFDRTTNQAPPKGIFAAERLTAAPTGGLLATPVALDTANTFNSAVEIRERGASDSTTSAITATLSGVYAWQQMGERIPATTPPGQFYFEDDDYAVPQLSDRDPIILAEGEGLAIVNVTIDSTAGWTVLDLAFEEFAWQSAINGDASVAGVGSIGAAARLVLSAATSPAGTGALSAGAGLKLAGAASMAGTGAVSAAGSVTRRGAATMAGVGTMAASSGPPPRQHVDLGSTEAVYDGTVQLPDGRLFGLTNGNPGKLLKWQDPSDLSTYTSVTFTEAGHAYSGAEHLIYNATTGLLYAGFTADLNDDPATFPIVAINPDDLSWSLFARDALGTDALNIGAVGLASDSTYLYVATKGGGESSWVYRYRLSDHVQVNSIQLPTGARRCHVIFSDGTRLYVSGTKLAGGQSWWFGWIELDLSAASTITVGANLTGNDDYLDRGSEVWIVEEQGGDVYRLPKDLSTPSHFSTGTGGSDGIVQDPSGNVWVGKWTTPGGLAKIDPSGPTLLSTRSLLTGETQPNEILPWSGGLIVFDIAGDGHNAQVIFDPLTTAALSGAASMAGAGAIAATPTVIRGGSVTAAGVGSTSAAPALTLGGSLAIAGSGATTAVGGVITSGGVSMPGTGATAVSGRLTASGATSATGVGTMTATTGPGAVNGTATMAGAGAMSSAGFRLVSGSASYAGTGTMSAAGGVIASAAAGLAGAATVDVAGRLTLSAGSGITGTGSMQASSTGFIPGSATMAGAGTLGAVGGVIRSGAFTAAGTGSIAGGPVLTAGGSVTLTGVGMIAVSPKLLTGGTLTAAGTGTMVPTAGLRRSGFLPIGGQGFMVAEPLSSAPLGFGVTGAVAIADRSSVTGAGLTGNVSAVRTPVRQEVDTADVRQ